MVMFDIPSQMEAVTPFWEGTMAQWLYLRNLGITFPAKNYKKLKIYSLLEHFIFFKVINSHSS